MGNDVIDNSSRHKPSVRFTLHTQRILIEIRLAYPLPLTTVATLGGGGAVGMEGLVFITVACVS